MPGTFPTLRTGARAQYPLERRKTFNTESVPFMDGGEQSYRNRSTALRAWVLELTGLSPNELKTLRAFFDSNKGRWGTFSFVDPISGSTITNCSFADDQWPESLGDRTCGVTLTIYEHA